MKFDTDRLNNIISNITAKDSFSHSYIIEEGEDEIRTDFIEKLVSGIECESEYPEKRPCGKCASCRQIAAGTSMDVYHMNMSGKNSYKTEDAVGMLDRLRMGSYGRYVIGIIDDADSLSEIIQNKLLKTLEEPEAGAIIILGSSNKDRLLKTVRSRCTVIRVSDYKIHQEKEILKKENLHEIVEMITGGEFFFYELREKIAKNINTRQDAEELIGLLEDEYRHRMIYGTSREDMVDAIDTAESALKDIKTGMDYNKALKRLVLEVQ